MLNEREDGSLRYGVLGEIVCGVVGSELRGFFLLDSTIVSFSLCIHRHITTGKVLFGRGNYALQITKHNK